MRTRRILTGLVLTLLPVMASAETPLRVAETVWVNSDASARVEIQATLANDFVGPLRLPVQLGVPSAIEATLRREGSGRTELPESSTTLVSTWDGTRRHIVVEVPSTTSAASEVDVVFTVSLAGERAGGVEGPHRFTFINTSDHPFADYSLEIVLPDGYAFSSVDGINASSGVTPRVTSHDGRHAVVVQTRLREYEGTVSISAAITREHRTGLVPIVAVLLSVGYLVRFRDLVARRTP